MKLSWLRRSLIVNDSAQPPRPTQTTLSSCSALLPAAAVMAAAAGSGLDQSPSHRKRTRAQRSFTTEDAQVIALPH